MVVQSMTRDHVAITQNIDGNRNLKQASHNCLSVQNKVLCNDIPRSHISLDTLLGGSGGAGITGFIVSGCFMVGCDFSQAVTSAALQVLGGRSLR